MKMKVVEYSLPHCEYKDLNRMAEILNKTRILVNRGDFNQDIATSLMFELNELMASYENEEHKDCVLATGAIETLKKLKKTVMI